MILASSEPGTVEWLTLAIAFLMPIICAILAASSVRKQSRFDLRNQNIIRVYEKLLSDLNDYAHATRRDQNVFDHYITATSQIAIARAHTSAEGYGELDGLEKIIERIWQWYNQARADPTAKEPMLQEIAKMWAILTTTLGQVINEQLGPGYTDSRWSWQNFKIDCTYIVFKAKERLWRERRKATPPDSPTTPSDSGPT